MLTLLIYSSCEVLDADNTFSDLHVNIVLIGQEKTAWVELRFVVDWTDIEIVKECA